MVELLLVLGGDCEDVGEEEEDEKEEKGIVAVEVDEWKVSCR